MTDEKKTPSVGIILQQVVRDVVKIRELEELPDGTTTVDVEVQMHDVQIAKTSSGWWIFKRPKDEGRRTLSIKLATRVLVTKGP